MVSVCFSLMANAVEHLLVCLLCILFGEKKKKGLFRSFAHLNIELFVFLL